MTNSKTRLRVARIAAGAVFAAGASLTAVGTASALDLGVSLQATEDGSEGGLTTVSGGASVSGGTSGETSGVDNGGTTTGETTTGETTTGETTTGETTTGETTTGETTNGNNGGGETTTGETTNGNNGGGETTTGETTTGETTTGETTTGETTNGNNGGGETTTGETTTGETTEGGTGGPEPATTGGSGGSTGETDTCVLSQSSVTCEDNTDTDAVGTKPISQETPKEELAETGAAETTFLLIGAATMIAGGVGFRLMPRLATRRTVA